MEKNAMRQGIKLLAMAGLLALVASKSAAAQASTQAMVKSLELINTTPLLPAVKVKN